MRSLRVPQLSKLAVRSGMPAINADASSVTIQVTTCCRRRSNALPMHAARPRRRHRAGDSMRRRHRDAEPGRCKRRDCATGYGTEVLMRQFRPRVMDDTPSAEQSAQAHTGLTGDDDSERQGRALPQRLPVPMRQDIRAIEGVQPPQSVVDFLPGGDDGGPHKKLALRPSGRGAFPAETRHGTTWSLPARRHSAAFRLF